MGKKILLAALFLTAYTMASSQGWLELGVKVMYGLNGFYNQNLAQDDQHSYYLHGAPSFGGVIGLNLGHSSVLNIEGLLLNNRQKLDFRENGGKTDNLTEWKNLDLYMVYRHYTNNGSHFEIGPKWSLVRSLEQTYAGQFLETEGLYEDNYFSAVAGLGGFITGSEAATLKIGFRLEYALTDLVSDSGEKEGYPAFYQSYSSYTATHPFRAGVFLELNFGIGREAKYICGRRKYLFQWR